ncbi:Eco57I restriction-modification methylase domain-containing protein [Actinoallomurus spadix]|uniref:Eco57I restriction-modification methylase domain-containing protein n=1 Tax=Actinoallomurus spadix TaxID=79912 RepID=UPI002093127A|nr:DNA methyltransferase [Actinoallomurus spadix]
MLRRVWPTLDTLDKAARERLRLMHGTGPEWIEYVLAELLGWGDALVTTGLDALALEVAEYDTTVTPSFALLEPGADLKPGNVRLLGLVTSGPPTRRVAGEGWSASPAGRLAQLCRHHDVPLGLATDGRWWTLVWAPRGGVTTTAVFDSVDWATAAERDVVRAFVSLLNRTRFFGVPETETLPKLLEDSKGNQEDITEALGVQVRQAVELLVAAIGRAHTHDLAAGGPGIGDVSAQEVYRGAVAVMMRVVFLLFAEERGLLPSDKELYRTSYSVGLLCAELEARAVEGTEEDLEHSTGAWHRLLATFNAVYYGVDHPDLTMHAHDGSIFDPDRFAWLPLNIDDRTVLHMLRAVQYVQIGTGRNRERRKLSFRTLDVEEIGYVYEGLLSFEGFHAQETVVGLIGKEGYEEEVPLRELEEHAEAAGSTEALAARLAAAYKDSKIGSAAALTKRLAPPAGVDEQEAERKLLAVTGGDYPLTRRLLPFYGIIRTDLRDLPVVILTDALYVTESSLRKNTGTHYTPRFLAEQVVEGALEPLVYEPGPLQTANKDEWKPKSSQEILSLKVADIAMGSAAFLVAACRYLAGHLVEAWSREGDEEALAYTSKRTDAALDAEDDPLIIKARRQIIEHCLYGVDINPMAVEMAKLSLWLVSMDPQRPFTFLDDRLIAGDSLLGITSLEQLEVLHMDPVRGRELHKGDDKLFDLTAGLRELVAELAEDRRRLTEIDGTTLEGLAKKRKVLAEVERKSESTRVIADLCVGTALAYIRKGGNALDNASGQALRAAAKLLSDRRSMQGGGGSRWIAELAAWDQARMLLQTDLPAGGFERDPFHWPLLFPEVFDYRNPRGPGFDAVVGNPPFLGGKKISGATGAAYREWLVEVVGRGERGHADLVAYFVLRAHEVLGANGQVGLLATNSLAQGDTREVGLDQLVERGTTIRRSIKSRPWPSKSAVLEYCAVWTSGAPVGPEAEFIADGAQVPGITPSLDPVSRVSGNPERLLANANISFIGQYVMGSGFVLDPAVAAELIAKDPRNKEVLEPYLSGQDLNSRPDCSASRYVINFRDWSLEKSQSYSLCFEHVVRTVKSERLRQKDEFGRRYWWQFFRQRPEMRQASADLDHVIALTRVSKVVMPVRIRKDQVISDSIVVFATDDMAMLALLSSAPHYWWAIGRASTLETRLRYTPSDVFETMPLPGLTQEMRELGERLDVIRQEVALSCNNGSGIGLTDMYNSVNNKECHDAGIEQLRSVHKAIDEAVCWAYGWEDLIPQLNHGMHPVGREVRFTVGPAVQREIVDRLLELNHERYAAEVAAGLHDKRNAPSSRGRLASAEQDTIF